MADLWVTVFIVGFFALCFAYVRACDRIVGSDTEALAVEEPDEAASVEPVR